MVWRADVPWLAASGPSWNPRARSQSLARPLTASRVIGPQAMQRGNGLALERFDGDRVNLLVPIGFQKPFRVGPPRGVTE
jgi:hypothetical protein